MIPGCQQNPGTPAAAAKEAAPPDSAAAFLWKTIQEDPEPGQLSWMEMRLEPFVFHSDSFPNARFAQPWAVRNAFGDYQISTTYYNSTFNEVKTADKAGRYGAVVTIHFASGITMERCYTLFHYTGELSEKLTWWRWAAFDKKNIVFELPSVLGINPAVAKTQSAAVAAYLRFGFYEDLLRRPYSARLLAGLYESSPDENVQDVKNDVIVRDRQWWIGLKQKLHPVQGFPLSNVQGPKVLPGAMALALRPSTAMSAGMSEKVSNQLDPMLSAWAQNSGEAFGVVLARNGNVFFRHSYGMRDGVPLKDGEPSHIASVTKTFTGILLMTCVDKGILSLDDEISKFFPSLKEIKTNKPITIRNLVMHTSGLPDLQLDELNDLEEVIKPILPFVHVGEKYSYSETGYSLVGKILEVVTGKCVAVLMKEWLLDPLQMKNTRVHGAASDAWSSPDDLAKVAQVIANQGRYGNVEFFSKETFAKMLPPPGKFQGAGIWYTRGANVADKPTPAFAEAEILTRVDSENQPLGYKRILGYGSVSGTTFAIDPDDGLVIIMTRNNYGKDFENYHKQFVKIISDNIKR